MKAVLQRVKCARVEVDGEVVGECGNGLMILLGVLLILFIVTLWHNKRMFRESVRKTLKGGDAL